MKRTAILLLICSALLAGACWRRPTSDVETRVEGAGATVSTATSAVEERDEIEAGSAIDTRVEADTSVMTVTVDRSELSDNLRGVLDHYFSMVGGYVMGGIMIAVGVALFFLGIQFKGKNSIALMAIGAGVIVAAIVLIFVVAK